MKTLTFGLFFATAVVAILPAHALAQDAEAHLQAGLELRREGRDAEALERFEAAYRMGQSAQALAQIALAEQALGRFPAAETHMSTAVQIQNDPWIASRLPQLQQALASIQAQLGTLEIVGGLPGAEVWIDGEARGLLPDVSRLRVRAGTVIIELRLAGYLPVQRQAEVSAGGTWRETVQMVQGQAQLQAGGVVQPQAQPGQLQYQGQYPAGGGVQVVGQPGYPVRPTRTETQPNWRLFGAGVGVFGGLWLLTGIVDLSLDPWSEGLGFVPVAGPFILMDQSGAEDFLLAILLIDGIAQLAGIVLAVLGLVIQQEVTVMALGPEPDAPTLTVLPWVAPEGTQGASAGLSFALGM